MNVAAMTVSPDSRYIATGAADGSIIIWSGIASPQTVIVEIQCPAAIQCVTSLSFSDNSDFLAATGGSYVLVWRVSDGSRIFSFEGRPEKVFCTWGRDNLNHATLSVLGLTYDGSMSVSIARAQDHSLCELVRGTTLGLSFSPPELLVLGKKTPRDFLVQSPDCKIVVTVDSQGCDLWRMAPSAPTYERHRLMCGPIMSSGEHSCVSYTADDQLVVGFSDGTIYWWDIFRCSSATGELRGVLTLNPGRGPASTVWSLSVSPLRSFLLVCLGDQTVTGTGARKQLQSTELLERC